MTAPPPKRIVLLASLLAPLLFLASCGWMEVPYEGGMRRTAAGGGGVSDPLFVGAGTVTVGRGDTVYAIARRHKVNMRAVIDANNLRPPYVLRIGQKLTLPRPREYTVRRGDTLSGIANRFNVSLYQTAKLNGLARPYVIRAGQRLRLSATQLVNQPVQAAAVTAPTPRPATSTPQGPSVKASTRAGVPSASGRGFLWPVKGRVLSSFGPKAGGVQNDGINIAATRGSAIKAAENGVVAYAGDGLKGLGQLVLVRHAGGWVTAYGHADALLVKRGDQVKRGQSIATVGSSGNVKTPQVHFQMRQRGRVVNPARHLG